MRTSFEISSLKAREKSAWKVIDFHLSNKKVPAKVRQAAAEFVLKRIYPEKHIIGGDGPDGEFVVRVEISDENQTPSETGNRISQYIEV